MHEGRHIDAQRVIAALNDDTYDSEATIIQTRLIMQSIEQSHQLGVVKKRNMFTNGPTQHFRRMFVVLFSPKSSFPSFLLTSTLFFASVGGLVPRRRSSSRLEVATLSSTSVSYKHLFLQTALTFLLRQALSSSKSTSTSTVSSRSSSVVSTVRLPLTFSLSFKETVADPFFRLFLPAVSVYALAAFGSYFTIERYGRRKVSNVPSQPSPLRLQLLPSVSDPPSLPLQMFLVGSWGQMISMIITFACLIPGTTSAANGAVFGLFLFLFFFGSTWLELPWLYPAEINPLRTRTNANAVSTLSNWLFKCVLIRFSPSSSLQSSPASFP
jgi:hypothetical protein